MNILITPSILSADLGCLEDEIKSVEPYADWLQVDVMDGHFVPNLSFGAPVLKNLKTTLPLDIHLMVENPEDRLQEFVDIGAAHITFHSEAVPLEADQEALLHKIRSFGLTAVIAIKPATPLSDVHSLLSNIDLLLIMSVEPGFGGQAFLPDVLSKVREARKEFPDLMIQMDGGIDESTAPLCIEAGATNLVSGSYIFSSDDRKSAIASLRPHA